MPARAPAKRQPLPPSPAAENGEGDLFPCPERYDWLARLRLLQRLRECFDAGARDPELLYLGGRFAASLGCGREACRFLDPLAEMLRGPSGHTPAFFPVGLLYLRALPSGEQRQVVAQELRGLAERNPRLAAWLVRTHLGPPEDWPSRSPAWQLRQIRANAEGPEPGGRATSAVARRTANGAETLVELAAASSAGYREGTLADVRASLEAMLLLDGDQPEVLRNLVVVTSEQQDREAFERYFRRCVKVLLWRMMRGDGFAAACEELLRFYAQVATLTDREFSAAGAKSSELIRIPGLLARWLEAHAGLVWLENVQLSRKQQQTRVGVGSGSEIRLGRVSLMRFWFRVFYPEFAPFLVLCSSSQAPEEPPPVAEPSRLPFDPAEQLLKRFMAWSKFNFGLQKDAGDHAQVVAALAGCAARIPYQAYTPALAQILAENETKPPNFHEAFQQACSLSLRLKLGDYLDAKDWKGLASWWQDADVMSTLSADLRAFIAFALCHQRQEEAGLRLVLELLPELTAEELKPEAQSRVLCHNVLVANCNRVREAEPGTLPQALAELKQKVEAIPDLPDLREFRTECLGQIEELEQSIILHQNIEGAIRRSKELVENGDFNAARQAIQDLTEPSDDVKKLKASLLDQITQAEEHHALQDLIQQAVTRSRELLDEGKEAEAKRIITDLPDDSEESRSLKAQILSQIDQAIATHRQIDSTVKRAKDLVEKRKFNEARRCLDALPADVGKLKASLLDQIHEAEEQAAVHDRIDFALGQVKKAIGKGDFREARRIIQALPNQPAQVEELKQRFLSQVAEVEQQWQHAQAENAEIMRWLARHNVDMSKVFAIAQQNSVSVSNQIEFNGLLKAIKKQLSSLG